MSTPLGSSQLFKPRPFYPHTIDQSLRFEDGDSAYLTRTFGSASNQRTWTWSAWIKRGNLGGSVVRLFNANDAGSPYRQTSLRFDSDQLRFFNDSTGTTYDVKSTQVFRDPSAWYHIVLAIDTTSGTASNRVKMYVNGSQITNLATSTYPAQNVDTYVNAARSHQIGASVTPSQHFDGYMAEVNFIDGLQLDPTSFGETKSGIWIPKDTSDLTFGTNGFRLRFQNSSAIGDDTSGNSNDFSPSGFATNDVMPDSPTNNFCTYNPLERNASGQSYQFIAQGNLNVGDYVSTDALLTIAGTMAMRSGKWYFEILRTAAVNGGYWGIIREDKFAGQNSIGTTGTSSGDYAYYVQFNGSLIKNGSTTSSFTSAFSTDDVIQVAYDADTGKVWFGRNNTWGGSGDPANGTNPAGTVDSYSDYGYKVYTSVIGSASSYEQATLNCGQDSSFAGEITAGGNADANGIGDFKYAPPSGSYGSFLALCSANLPNPAIDPAKDQAPADHFNTVLYTGTGTTDKSVTGVGFRPDWTWIKSRSNTYAHWLNDSVRGAGKGLRSDSTDSEYTTLPIFLSFDSDGFTVDVDDATANGTTNGSGSTFVAWNWLAGGSTSSNSDGTITSSVSANTKAGFSIVSYTGTGSAATVGHGLSQAPEWILAKQRDANSTDWYIYHSALGASAYITLNGTAAAVTSSSDPWNATAPTNSVFSVSSAASPSSSGTMIAYCFHSVNGYSKVGTYESNNSTDGPFVFTGFKPAFILMKDADRAAMAWTMFDNKRNPLAGNPNDESLTPSGTAAEPYDSNSDIDFLSNGFKLRGGSSSWNNYLTETYIYIAFAEQPLKYSNAE